MRRARAPIQKPFRDEQDESWSEGERELLLQGVARGDSFIQIAADITTELRYRSAIGCEREFGYIRRTLNGAEE